MSTPSVTVANPKKVVRLSPTRYKVVMPAPLAKVVTARVQGPPGPPGADGADGTPGPNLIAADTIVTGIPAAFSVWGDARYDALGAASAAYSAASAALAAHLAASDPHPQYTTAAELASALTSYLTTAAAASGYQPLDSDLTAIAALSTTPYGRALLTLADVAALAALGLARTAAANTFVVGGQLVQTGAAGTLGLSVQGAGSQTADLQRWLSSTGTVLAKVDSAGRIGIGRGTTAIAVPLSIAADAGGNGFEVVGTAGTLRVQQGGVQTAVTIDSSTVPFVLGTSAGATVAGSEVRLTTSGTAVVSIKTTGTTITSYAAGVVGLIVKGAASQTADLHQLQDSAGAVLERTNKDGYRIIRKTSAPADADLSAGEMTLWFDSTNGSAELMVKAKQADGTVRTGLLALS